jgi:hypothetical protein
LPTIPASDTSRLTSEMGVLPVKVQPVMSGADQGPSCW